MAQLESKSKGLFVLGTGTDIGKTFITGLLVKTLRDGQYKAGYYKARSVVRRQLQPVMRVM